MQDSDGRPHGENRGTLAPSGILKLAWRSGLAICERRRVSESWIISEWPVIREEPTALRRASPECYSTRCFADCRFEPAESAPGNSLSRKLTYYLRLVCIRPVRALGKSASTPSRYGASRPLREPRSHAAQDP